MKVIVDEGVPRHLVDALRKVGIDAHRFRKAWEQVSNGKLIAAIEAEGFDVLLTNDKNIASQQNLQGRAIAIVALPLNRRSAIVARIADIVDTIRRARPGQHIVMHLDGSRHVAGFISGDMIEEELPPVATFKD